MLLKRMKINLNVAKVGPFFNIRHHGEDGTLVSLSGEKSSSDWHPSKMKNVVAIYLHILKLLRNPQGHIP